MGDFLFWVPSLTFGDFTHEDTLFFQVVHLPERTKFLCRACGLIKNETSVGIDELHSVIVYHIYTNVLPLMRIDVFRRVPAWS